MKVKVMEEILSSFPRNHEVYVRVRFFPGDVEKELIITGMRQDVTGKCLINAMYYGSEDIALNKPPKR